MAEFVFTILYHPFPWWFRLWKICLQCGIEKIPAGGHGNLLQYSCLENPWTDEPSGLQSMWSQRFGHDWVTNTRIYYVTTFEILSYPKHQKGMRCAPKGPWNLVLCKMSVNIFGPSHMVLHRTKCPRPFGMNQVFSGGFGWDQTLANLSSLVKHNFKQKKE